MMADYGIYCKNKHAASVAGLFIRDRLWYYSFWDKRLSKPYREDFLGDSDLTFVAPIVLGRFIDD